MKKQDGIASLSVLLAVFAFIVIIRITFAVVPMYYDDKVVETILDDLVSSGKIDSRTSTRKARDLIRIRLDRNQVEVDLEGLAIRRTRNGSLLFWDYEHRSGFISNIELVGRFQHQKELAK